MKTGILSQAQNAKKANENATVEENIKLAFQGAQIGKYTGTSTEEQFKADVLAELESFYGSGNVVVGDRDNEGKYEVIVLGKKYEIDANGNVSKKSGISIAEQNIMLNKGQSQSLHVNYSEGLSGDIEWSSSNTNKVKVENGEITVIEDGASPVTITAVLKNTEHTATTEVKIVQEITEISSDDVTVSKGDTTQIIVKTKPSEGIVQDIEYEFTSEDEGIATVDKNSGIVTGVSSGNVKINIKGIIEGRDEVLNAECNVNVPSVITSVTELREGDEVLYIDQNENEIPCKVLYDSTGEYGIQIISKNTVGDSIELGNGTGSEESSLDSTNFSVAQQSYNTAIAKLNNIARIYLNNDLATSARCAGSNPSEIPITTEYDNGTYVNDKWYSKYDKYNNKFKVSDGSVIASNNEDYVQMQKISCSSGNYWLASRGVNEKSGNKGQVTFSVRWIKGGVAGGAGIVGLEDTDSSYILKLREWSRSYSCGVRPVFILKDSIFYIEENGVRTLVK